MSRRPGARTGSAEAREWHPAPWRQALDSLQSFLEPDEGESVLRTGVSEHDQRRGSMRLAAVLYGPDGNMLEASQAT